MITKKYLPISTKKLVVEKIIKNSLIQKENGLFQIDYINKELSLDMTLINFYTDVDLSVKDYDDLAETGEVENIKTVLSNEYNFIKLMVEQELDQLIKVNNSIEGIIANKLTELINKLPTEDGMKDIIEKLPSIINDADPNKLKFVADAIGWNNGKKLNRQQKRKNSKEV